MMIICLKYWISLLSVEFYTVKEINDFLDETYNKFLCSAMKIQISIGFNELSRRKGSD